MRDAMQPLCSPETTAQRVVHTRKRHRGTKAQTGRQAGRPTDRLIDTTEGHSRDTVWQVDWPTYQQTPQTVRQRDRKTGEPWTSKQRERRQANRQADSWREQ